MIVVDTSVWVDLLRERETQPTIRLRLLLADGAPVAITEVIRMELLQGVADDEQAALLDDKLAAYPVIGLELPSDVDLAARLYRQSREAGVSIRRSLDCLIAAPCVRTGATLLHDDRDFASLAACSNLRVDPASRGSATA